MSRHLVLENWLWFRLWSKSVLSDFEFYEKLCQSTAMCCALIAINWMSSKVTFFIIKLTAHHSFAIQFARMQRDSMRQASINLNGDANRLFKSSPSKTTCCKNIRSCATFLITNFIIHPFLVSLRHNLAELYMQNGTRLNIQANLLKSNYGSCMTLRIRKKRD